ncbi:MSCRAMM family protein [Candidatus Blastococcus massiliensis]|uniref:MSCRAMM family protein n=1 Tax=Candidatus Blastococcus massiliensis TaxID=1470358 RepID=UPI0004AE17B4|nr:prealbumin-like fold domain-containing protein [Candidatus Blastococcus massiliensis]
MKQSASPHPSRARWRLSALGSLVAIATLALGVLVAPAAVAAPAPPAVPDLGSVRALDVDLDARGSVPAGLDLSGAAIRFSSPGFTGTCLTQELGWCDVRFTADDDVSGNGTPSLRLPAGRYTVTQVASMPVAGLTPAPGTLATVRICDCWHTVFGARLYPISKDLDIDNVSEYRHTITARVVDQATGDPVSNARFRLTGPGFRTLLFDRDVLDAGVERTDRKGELTFATTPRTQIFRPGAWTLSPVDSSSRYTAVTLDLSVTATGGNTWDVGTLLVSTPSVPLPPATGSATLALQTTGPVPEGLDLSGAVFELSRTGSEIVAGTCTTGPAGTCAIEAVREGATSARGTEGAEIALPAGTYSVRQTAAPTGLAVAQEIGPLDLCTSTTPTACVSTTTVTNASVFRTRVEVRVLSGDVPVQALGVTLAGPGHEPEPAVTDEEGAAAWDGWFVPGAWSFTVEGGSEPVSLTMGPRPADGGDAWRVEITLPTAEEPGEEPGGEPGGEPGEEPAEGPAEQQPGSVPGGGPQAGVPAPTTSPQPPAQGTPSAAPGDPAEPRAATPSDAASAGAGGAPGDGAAGAPRARVVDRSGTPVEEEQDAPATPESVSAPPPADQGSGQLFVAAEDAPELVTESSSQVLTAGLVASVGILFVGVVVGGYSLLRSRTRRRL